MTPDEALQVLATASAFDERKPSRVQAIVWAEELSDTGITLDEAMAAVRAYYRANPDGRVRPGHLLPHVLAARRDALARARQVEIADREQYMLERGGGTHPFQGPAGGTCEVCGLTDEDGPKHPRRRSLTTEGLLAELRKNLPPGDTAFREQLAGKMREPRALPGS